MSPTVRAGPELAFPRSRAGPGARGAGGGRGGRGKEHPSRSPCPRAAGDHRLRDALPSLFIFGVAKKGSASVFVFKNNNNYNKIKKKKQKKEKKKRRPPSIQRISLRPDCTKCILKIGFKLMHPQDVAYLRRHWREGEGRGWEALNGLFGGCLFK